MKKALIKNGIVDNIIIASDNFEPESNITAVTITDQIVDIGYLWDGENFTKPTPAIDVLKKVLCRSPNIFFFALT